MTPLVLTVVLCQIHPACVYDKTISDIIHNIIHAAHPLVCCHPSPNRPPRQAHDRFVVSPSGPSPPARLDDTPNHTQTPTHKHDKIRMKSPRHPAMQTAEPFIDPAGTHCAGATDGEIAGDASLSPQSCLVTERAIMAGTTSLPCTSRTSTYAYRDSGKSLELFASARYEQP